MDNGNRRKSPVLVLAALLAAAWVLPPLMHRALHLCPVRPDGVSPASAVPAFARKYDVGCIQCHSAFPVLNAFGRQFKLNGYVMGGEDTVLQSSDKSLWTEKLFPIGAVIRSRPFDNGKGTVGNGSDGTSGFKMQAVNDVDIHIAGGDVARHVSWFGELDANVGGGFAPGSGDLQLGYHPSPYLNIVAARRGFYVMDPYQTLTGVGSPTLAYRATQGLLSDQNSLSGNTLDETSQTLMAFGVVDKEKLGALYYAAGATGGSGDDSGRNVRNANVRLAFESGNGLMLGCFGTFGREVPANIPVSASNANTGEKVGFVRAGADAMLELGDVAARAAFLYAYDSAPQSLTAGLAPNRSTDRAAYAEIMYVFKMAGSNLPFLVPLVRENWYTTYNGTRQFNYVTAQLAHYFTSNVKAFVEYSVDTKTDSQGTLPSVARVSPGNRLSGQVELGF